MNAVLTSTLRVYDDADPARMLLDTTDRAEITRLSGTPEVPILVLDDGTVISDSSRIVKWAREHPASQ